MHQISQRVVSRVLPMTSTFEIGVTRSGRGVQDTQQNTWQPEQCENIAAHQNKALLYLQCTGTRPNLDPILSFRPLD